MRSTLVAISGQAASGKTTLARFLSEELGWPSYSKDFFKNPAYEILGFPKTVEEHAVYGRLAHECMDRAIEELLGHGASAIIEGPLADSYYRPFFEKLKSRWNVQILQIQLICDGDVLLQRWIERERVGGSHPGNQGLLFLESMRPKLLAGRMPVIDFDSPRMEFDTTNPDEIDFKKMLDWVRSKSI
jgi:cytidylate kinase